MMQSGWLPPDRALKPIVFVVLLLPAAVLTYRLFTGQLGPNPIEVLSDETGEWALRLLLLSLTVSPLRWLSKSARPLRYRRLIGLYAWFYAGLHVIVYLILDQQLDLQAIIVDIVERPYITAGFLAFVILCALGLTSNRFAVRRLRQSWQRLHRWTYIAATAAIAHFIWLAKGEIDEPYVYAAILLALLLARFVRQTTGP